MDRLTRLHNALEVAERVGNTFLAANLRAAIREEQLHQTPLPHPPHGSQPPRPPVP